jgi:hypothetical protein
MPPIVVPMPGMLMPGIAIPVRSIIMLVITPIPFSGRSSAGPPRKKKPLRLNPGLSGMGSNYSPRGTLCNHFSVKIEAG